MSFLNYLKPYRVEKGERFSHSGISFFKGRFCIPEDQTDAFMQKYYDHVYVQKKPCDLIEKHVDVCCLLYDLDFKISKNAAHRAYTDEMIEKFIQCVTKVASTYIDESHNAWDCFVFEKNNASVKKDSLKDGVHFMFPYIITAPAVQHLIREELLVELEEIGLFDNMDIHNSIDDIVDKTVIDKNGWMMPGSNKPDGLPYKLTKHYSYNNNTEFTNFEPRKRQNSRWYTDSIELLKESSIRRYIAADTASLKDDMIDIITDFTETYNQKECKPNTKIYYDSINKSEKPPDLSTIKTIKELVTILDGKRAETYIPWIEVGWCLYNISKGTELLLDSWIKFSQRCTQFTETAGTICKEKWEKDNKTGASGKGLGTLHMWAKKDNPEAYLEIIKKGRDYLICQVVKKNSYERGIRDRRRPQSHAFKDLVFNITLVLKNKCENEFICTDYQKKIWYKFNGTRWRQCDGDVEIRRLLSSGLRQDFMDTSIKYRRLAASLDSEHPNKSKYETVADDLSNVCSKLLDFKFRGKIMEQACESMWWEDDCKFEDMLDTNNHLIGLKDGIYDLEKNEFRKSRCDDYISLSTKNNWKDYKWTDPEVIEIINFLKKIMPDEKERNYLLRTMGSFLSGTLKGEIFHIWVGQGGNGKSKLLDLLRFSMGDYYATLDVSSLTQKRSSSEKAKPEIARLQGKRAVFASEPDGKDKLNMGIVKELTGGDTIAVRQLHKEHKELTVRFNLVLCCNILPKVEADDHGTWRRLKPLPFESSFVENPDPNDKYQHKVDTDLGEKLKCWGQAFFWLLTKYYPEFLKDEYRESPKVLNMMREYKQNNDDYSDFISEFITKTGKNTDMLHLDTIFPIYQHWFRQTVDDKTPTRKDFTKALEHTCGKISSHDGKKIWYGSKETEKKQQFVCQ